jgi:glutaredoxin-related protein
MENTKTPMKDKETKEDSRTWCKLCMRKSPNFCKRHTPKIRVTTMKVYTEEQVRELEQEAERRGLKKALEITREAVKVGQSLQKNALVYGHHEEVGLLICGVENELVKLLSEENGKQNAISNIEKKENIREYLQKMLDRWNKYDELDGFVAENFRVDLEKTLEYWDLRIADNKQELDKAREEGRKDNQKNEKPQFCIECGELVDDNSSCKNCHDHCRLEL